MENRYFVVGNSISFTEYSNKLYLNANLQGTGKYEHYEHYEHCVWVVKSQKETGNDYVNKM